MEDPEQSGTNIGILLSMGALVALLALFVMDWWEVLSWTAVAYVLTSAAGWWLSERVATPSGAHPYPFLKGIAGGYAIGMVMILAAIFSYGWLVAGVVILVSLCSH